jgi:hypothetical protein
MKIIKWKNVLAGLFLLTVACSSNKAPAEQAINAAQSAYDAAKAEALKYIPERAHAVEAALASARASFGNGDYEAALHMANGVLPEANDLNAAAAVKKEELNRTWADLSNGVPKMAEAIRTRVHFLSKSKALPENITSSIFDAARSGLADLNRMWSDANGAYRSGNMTTAVATATKAKDQAVRLMASLGMQIPAAAGN